MHHKEHGETNQHIYPCVCRGRIAGIADKEAAEKAESKPYKDNGIDDARHAAHQFAQPVGPHQVCPHFAVQ